MMQELTKKVERSTLISLYQQETNNMHASIYLVNFLGLNNTGQTLNNMSSVETPISCIKADTKIL